MSSVNKAIIVGRLGSDPELKQVSHNQKKCRFSIATNENWVDKDGNKQSRTEWHRIAVWGKQAELCAKYLAKGSYVYVEGKLQTDKWQDKNGQERESTNIVANVIEFIGEKQAGPVKDKKLEREVQFDEKDLDFGNEELPF